MEQRRFALAMALTLAIWFGWSFFFLPKPQPPKKVEPKPAPTTEEAPAIAEIPGEELPEVKAPPRPKLPGHPRDSDIVLGSADDDSGFFMEVKLTTEGAAVREILLNDKRYCVLHKPGVPLSLVGEVGAPASYLVDHPQASLFFRTLQTSVDVVDKQLEEFKTSLDQLDWKIVDRDPDGKSVSFRINSPDNQFEITKRYALTRFEKEEKDKVENSRDVNSKGYQLALELTFKNLSDARQTVAYSLQGPVGLPLEDIESSRSKFQDLRMGFLTKDGTVKSGHKTALQVVKEEKSDKVEDWRTPVRYIGVDIQYFAALLIPQEDQNKDSYVAISRPQLLRTAKEEAQSEISVSLTSTPLVLEPGKSVTHKWAMFAGPKREILLDPFDAGTIVDFGFASAIARGMLWLLKFFHFSIGLPWVLSIVALTVLVRACMFPISKKQATSAKIMKALRPKIAEIKKKYGDDKQKFTKAQFELFNRYGYNPFSGCLPLFLQLPIFIGLYNSLNSAVELRMASFLWIDNLAGPDRLMDLPFDIPFLGTNDLNLLPILTTILYIIQSKILAPPAMDEQAEMQMKMMPYMMAFMGFLFYKVPSGLCVYFIASSVWGMAERKLLDRMIPEPKLSDDGPGGGGGGDKGKGKPGGGGLFAKFLAMADAAANDAGMQTPPRDGSQPSTNGDGQGDTRTKEKKRRK